MRHLSWSRKYTTYRGRRNAGNIVRGKIMHRRLILICLGLLFLLAACSNASTGQSTNQVTSSQASSNSTRAATTDRTSSAGVAHATPTHNSGGVTVSSSTGSSTSASSSTANGQAGSLVLTLACSGPKAQDGFHMSGSQAHACVYTSPGAHLTIQVSFCGNKPDTSSALQGTFTANGSGFYEWIWKPQANCPSAWSTTVTAQLNGQSAVVSEGSSAQTSSQSTSKGSAHSSSSSSSSVNVPDGW
jgi:hypothetical protein